MPSKNPESTYLQWAQTFMTLDAPIVLFTPPSHVKIFKAMRPSKPLHVIPQSFDDLEMWKLHKSLWEIHHAMDHEKHHHSPELYAIWAQKSTFVYNTFLLNPFNTEYFFWCDIGAFRGPTIPETVRMSFPTTTHLPADRILLCSINPLIIDEITIQGDGIPGNFTKVDRIVGGLWGGSGVGCYQWHVAYCAMLQQYFNANRFAGKDQSVMLSAYIDNPSLAYVTCASSEIQQVPTIVITDKVPYNIEADKLYVNPWFYLQYLLSTIGFPFYLDPSYVLKQ